MLPKFLDDERTLGSKAGMGGEGGVDGMRRSTCPGKGGFIPFRLLTLTATPRGNIDNESTDANEQLRRAHNRTGSFHTVRSKPQPHHTSQSNPYKPSRPFGFFGMGRPSGQEPTLLNGLCLSREKEGVRVGAMAKPKSALPFAAHCSSLDNEGCSSDGL